jgi:hypothetical protein
LGCEAECGGCVDGDSDSGYEGEFPCADLDEFDLLAWGEVEVGVYVAVYGCGFVKQEQFVGVGC